MNWMRYGSGNRRRLALSARIAFALPLLAIGCSSNSVQQLAKKSETGMYIRAPGVIAAQNFVLVDASGRPVAELSSVPSGGAGLVLLDQTAKPRAALITTQTGEPGLKLYDANGVVRAAVVVSSDNTAGVALYDPSGHSRAALVESPAGEARLTIIDAAGRAIEVIPDSRNASR
jgi:hypothetical protein